MSLVGILPRRHFLVDRSRAAPTAAPTRRSPAPASRSRSGRSAGSSARGGDGRRSRAAAPRRRRWPAPATCSVSSRFLVCSRTSAMLKVLRFSTRTLPLRSNSTPRGAGSGSRRRWLFSAISANFSCCATWKIQKPTASSDERAGDHVLEDRQPRRQAAAIVGNQGCHGHAQMSGFALDVQPEPTSNLNRNLEL